MEQYSISINGVTVFSGRKIAKIDDQPNWMASIKQLHRQLKADQRQQQGIIRIGRLMVNAGELSSRIAYPLKQGNCIIKLLDQAICELGEIDRPVIAFDHVTIFREMFVYDEEEDQHQSSNQIEWATTPTLRRWNLLNCTELLKKCKQHIIIGQICFITERIRMASFIGEVKANRYLGTANKSRRHLATRYYQRSSADENQLMLPQDQNKPQSTSRRRLTPNSSNRNLKLYEELGNTMYGGMMPSRPKSRLFSDGNYTLMWDATNKEYYDALLPTHGSDKDARDTSFIGRLNTRLKYLKRCKEDTSLRFSLKQNYCFVGVMLTCMMVLVLLSLALAEETNLLICSLTFAAVLAWCYSRILRQQIYSRDSFRTAIKNELEAYHQSGVSNRIYEMQRGAYDVRAIRKQEIS